MSSRIPLEIYFKFINEVSDGSRNTASLSACSQGCSAWAEYGQQLLFSYIDLGQASSGSKYSILATQIDPFTARGAVLGGYIRHLDVAIGTSSSPQYGLQQGQFVLLVSRCPQLRDLTLRSTIAKFDAKTMVKLRSTASEVGRCIRTLRLIRCAPHSTIVYQLLSVWSTIQRLDIDCRIAPHGTPPSPTAVELQELALGCGERLPSRLIDWLLSRSKNSLEVLEIRDEPGPLVKYIAAERAQSIRSLSLPCFNRSSVEVVRLCPELEELRIVFHQKAVLSHLHDLPTTIRHIAFQNVAQNFPHAHLLMIFRNLPSLESVIYHHSAEEDKLPALQEAYRLQNTPLHLDCAPLFQRRGSL